MLSFQNCPGSEHHNFVPSRSFLDRSPERRETAPEEKKMAGVVVLFDFDCTLIDLDSDRWVVQKMGLTRAFDLWNTLKNATMGLIHEQGKMAEDVAQCLKEMPLDTHIRTAIKSAYALG